MSATLPISAAALAPSASAAPSANSSLADFLLAASGDTGHDFKAIAATFFSGAETATPTKAQSLVKGVADAKPEPPKTGIIPDPAAHPELTVPLFNIPMPWVQGTPEAEKEAAVFGLQRIGSSQEEEVGFRGQVQIKSAADANPLKTSSSTQRASLPEAQSAMAFPSTVEPINAKETAVGAKPKETGSSTSDGSGLVNPPAKDRTTQKEEALLGTKPLPENGVLGKKYFEIAKPSGDQSTSSTGSGQSKHVTTQAGIDKRALPANANIPTDSSDPSRSVATDSIPLTPPPEPPAVAPGGEVAASPVASGVLSQSESLAASALKGSSSTSGRTAVGRPSSAKDRIGKERGVKDARAAANLSGDSPFTQGARMGGPSANPGTGTSKDAAAFVLPTHSGAHSKQESSKQSADMPPSSTSLMDTDGPDEALPTTTPLPVTAKFVQGMSQSEFRVGMQSQEFGSIDIRTSVARHMFSAQISVEHSDVAKSLTTDLPTLYSKLADQHVPVANIVIQGQSLATSSGLAQDSQPRSWQPQSQSNARSNVEAAIPLVTEMLAPSGRLDVRI